MHGWRLQVFDKMLRTVLKCPHFGARIDASCSSNLRILRGGARRVDLSWEHGLGRSRPIFSWDVAKGTNISADLPADQEAAILVLRLVRENGHFRFLTE